MSEAGRKKTSQLQPSLAAGGRPSGIFISHATADKELVDALVDLLQTGIGVPHDQIFCTSLEGHGIPEGEDFADFIRDKLQGAGHVIMVITPRYYESAFCLCELGATWIQSGSAFPLIVPPLGFSDMKAVLSGVQAGLINDASKLDNLRDRLKQRSYSQVEREAGCFPSNVRPASGGINQGTDKNPVGEVQGTEREVRGAAGRGVSEGERDSDTKPADRRP